MGHGALIKAKECRYYGRVNGQDMCTLDRPELINAFKECRPDFPLCEKGVKRGYIPVFKAERLSE